MLRAIKSPVPIGLFFIITFFLLQPYHVCTNPDVDLFQTTAYPHLYAQLEGEDVNSFKEVHKKGRSWDKALGDVEGWLI